jgi:DNA-3-methyladenine glycosylase I
MPDRPRSDPPARTLLGEDGVLRCAWSGADPQYRTYHDSEWGFPVGDDRRLFEKLSLEGFQAGLSWLTILRRREAFRRAFAGFDPERVARFGSDDIERLLGDAAIIRHRGKIEAVINNAGCLLEMQRSGLTLAHHVWSFAPPPAPPASPPASLPASRAGRPAGCAPVPAAPPPASTPESHALARDLRRRGWRFVGPTTVYAFMQSMGLVNDHDPACAIRPAAQGVRDGFVVP